MKIYELKLNYSEVKKGLTVDITRTAAVNCGDYDFKLSDMAVFLDDIKKIYKDVKRLAKVGHPVEIELTVAEYKRHVNGDHCTLSQENFDRWEYLGTAESDGIHLNPDGKYTEPSHDIWLDFEKFDPLHDITA